MLTFALHSWTFQILNTLIPLSSLISYFLDLRISSFSQPLSLSLTWVCIPETVARLTSQLEDLEAEKQQREEQLFVMREAIISILGRKYQI
jgi:hypothetical protein